MFLIVVFSAYVAAEWVEIAQQHYRKPFGSHTSFAKIHKPFQDDLKKPWEYRNETIGSGELGVSTHRIDTYGRTPYFYTDKPSYSNEKQSSQDYSENDNLKGTVEKVSNVGNVKRVKLNNSLVKPPNINLRPKYVTNRYAENKDIERENNAEMKPVHGKVQNNLVIHKTTPRNHFLAIDDTVKYQDDGYSQEIPIVKKTVPKLDDEKYDLNQSHKFQNITETLVTPKENKQIKVTDQIIYTSSNENGEVHNKVITKVNKGMIAQKKDVNSSSKDRNNLKVVANNHPYNNDKPKFKLPTKDSTVEYKESENISKLRKNNEAGQRKVIINRPKDRKATTIEHLMKFLKVVADTISKNSQRTITGKVRYLHDLKDTILAKIEEQIDAAWAEDNTDDSSRRQSRAAPWRDEARGHVEFPSSESALMTISFLTFAVFLIKLVLQVIQTYKNKSMMVAPLVLAAASRGAFSRTTHQH